jgi:hypothetical protein
MGMKMFKFSTTTLSDHSREAAWYVRTACNERGSTCLKHTVSAAEHMNACIYTDPL